ncbi:MAG: hypothetical protein PHR35_01660 [Kiritimatiellae bacterium]|nr:hypothetical protein [Kiritimatiellia bacterium]
MRTRQRHAPGTAIRLAPIVGLLLAGGAVFSARAGTPSATPPGFAESVEAGWLPELCVRGDNPESPASGLPDWSRPRDGKRVRVLFICNSQEQYEPLAVARAFDLDCDLIPLWTLYSWRDNPHDPDTMNLLRHYLGTRRYDAIAMAGAWLSALPDDCEEAIAELIRERGVGFVYALPGIFPRVPEMWGKPSPILDPLLPIVLDRSGYKQETHRVLPAGPHELSRGTVLEKIDWYCNTDGAVAPEATVLLRSERHDRALAAAITRGKGRVLAYNRCYGENTYGYPFLPVVVCPETEETIGKRCRWLGVKESEVQFYNWLGRAILWSARAEPPVRIEAASVAHGSVAVTVSNTTSRKVTMRLKGTAHSPFDSIRKSFDKRWRVPAGATRTRSFQLPNTGRQGAHLLDLALANSEGKVGDTFVLSFSRPGALRATLEPDFALHLPDDEVRVPVRIEGLPAGRPFAVRAELFDLDGRLLAERRHEASNVGTGAAMTVTVPLNLKPTLISSALANLRVTVSADGTAVEARDQLFVKQDPRWEQFHVKAYAGVGHDLICSDATIEALKRSGHDTISYSYADPYRARIGTETGLRCVAGHVSSAGGHDPAKIGELVGWLRKFSPVVYEQQDEPELQTTPCAEARFDGPADRERFQKWLIAKYGTVAALNEAWGMRYATWQDAQRLLWHEVLNTTNWAAWFDSRRDLDCWFADRYALCAEAIRRIEPDRFCPINPRSLATFGGIDLRDFCRRLNASSLYNSFCARPPMGYLELGAQWVEFAQSVGGYTWPSQPNGNGMAREAWDSVRHGVKHLAWFAPFCDESPPSGRFSYLAGDLTLNEKGKAIAAINRQLLAGPGDVAVNTAPVSEGVFIYYPRSLFYTHELAFMQKQLLNDPTLDPSKMTGLGPWMEQLPNAFVQPLRALGYQFQFGDEEDLTAERLSKTRVVFLSYAVCLGLRELDLLREFVTAGGCVVADGGTARRDGDGRMYFQTPAAFREVFGVGRTLPNPTPIVARDGVVTCGAVKVEGVAPEMGVAYRNGKAFFLDFALPAGADGTLLVQQIMSLAGVAPTYALSDNIEKDGIVASVMARRLGDLTWLFVVGEGRESDGRYRLALPRAQRVYELTADRSLGVCTSIEDRIRFGQARVYALSSDPVAQLRAELVSAKCRPGDVVTIRYSLAPVPADAADRVLRLAYRWPTGSVAPAASRVLLLRQGKGEIRIFLPLNMSAGKAEVVATDLATGAASVTALSVQR